jgi:hypothetical protein
MPTIRFPQYLKKHGLYLFIAANETYLPGSILERQGQGFWPYDELKKILKVPALSWRTKVVMANIPGAIEGKSKVGAQGQLKLPFLTIQGGLQHRRYVDFSIGAVRQCIFVDDDLRLWNPLSKRLKSLANTKPKVWESIKGRYLVRSTWSATEYKVNLGRAWTGKLGAQLKKQIFPYADATVDINPETKVVNIFGNFIVPFAFQGLKLQKLG